MEDDCCLNNIVLSPLVSHCVILVCFCALQGSNPKIASKQDIKRVFFIFMTTKERINDLGKNFYFLCPGITFNASSRGMLTGDQSAEVTAYGGTSDHSIAARLLKIITIEIVLNIFT